MNFLAHGFRHTADPWRCAGTALPDWVRFFGHRFRIQPQATEPFVRDDDARMRSLALGVVRHFADDREFHGSAAFRAACAAAEAELKPLRSDVPRFRVGFAAHVLVEMCLDAELMREEPQRLDAYYRALEAIDAETVEVLAERIRGAAVPGLRDLVLGFVRAQFLREYGSDEGLATRFAQVAGRVDVPVVVPALVRVLPAVRALVAARARDLVAPALRERVLS